MSSSDDDDHSAGFSGRRNRRCRRLRNQNRLNSIITSDSSSDSENIRTVTNCGRRVKSVLDSMSDNDSDINISHRHKKTVLPLKDSDIDSEGTEENVNYGNNANGTTNASSIITGRDSLGPTQEGETINYSEMFNNDSNSNSQLENCPICFTTFLGQEIASPESCDHNFCLECLLEWSKKSNTCPVDRLVFNLLLVRRQLEGRIIRRIPIDKCEQVWQDEESENDNTYCEICGQCNREDRLLLCDACDLGYHCECLDPPVVIIPLQEWYCPDCKFSRAERVLSRDVLAEFHELLRSRFRPSELHRTIARTQASESVRFRVQQHRAARISNELRTFDDYEIRDTTDLSVAKHRSLDRHRFHILDHRIPISNSSASLTFNRNNSGFVTSIQNHLNTSHSAFQDSFDDESEDDASVVHPIPTVKRTLSYSNNEQILTSSGNTVSRRLSNIRKRVPSPAVSSSSLDVLGNILETQSILHSSSKDFVIKRDGSLTLKAKDAVQQRPQNPSPQSSQDNRGNIPSQTSSYSEGSSSSRQVVGSASHGYTSYTSHNTHGSGNSEEYDSNHHNIVGSSGHCSLSFGDYGKKDNLVKETRKSQSEDEVDIYSDIESVADDDDDAVDDNETLKDAFKCTPSLDNLDDGGSDSSDNELIIDEDAKAEEEEVENRVNNERLKIVLKTKEIFSIPQHDDSMDEDDNESCESEDEDGDDEADEDDEEEDENSKSSPHSSQLNCYENSMVDTQCISKPKDDKIKYENINDDSIEMEENSSDMPDNKKHQQSTHSETDEQPQHEEVKTLDPENSNGHYHNSFHSIKENESSHYYTSRAESTQYYKSRAEEAKDDDIDGHEKLDYDEDLDHKDISEPDEPTGKQSDEDGGENEEIDSVGKQTDEECDRDSQVEHDDKQTDEESEIEKQSEDESEEENHDHVERQSDEDFGEHQQQVKRGSDGESEGESQPDHIEKESEGESQPDHIEKESEGESQPDHIEKESEGESQPDHIEKESEGESQAEHIGKESEGESQQEHIGKQSDIESEEQEEKQSDEEEASNLMDQVEKMNDEDSQTLHVSKTEQQNQDSEEENQMEQDEKQSDESQDENNMEIDEKQSDGEGSDRENNIEDDRESNFEHIEKQSDDECEQEGQAEQSGTQSEEECSESHANDFDSRNISKNSDDREHLSEDEEQPDEHNEYENTEETFGSHATLNESDIDKHKEMSNLADVEDISEAGSEDLKHIDRSEDVDIDSHDQLDEKYDSSKNSSKYVTENDISDVESKVARLFQEQRDSDIQEEEFKSVRDSHKKSDTKESAKSISGHQDFHSQEDDREEGEIIEDAPPQKRKDKSSHRHEHIPQEEPDDYLDLTTPRINISDLPRIPKIKRDKSKNESTEDPPLEVKRTSVLGRVDLGSGSEISWKRLSKNTRERSYRDGKPKDERVLFREREFRSKDKRDDRSSRKGDAEKRKEEVKRTEAEKAKSKNDYSRTKEKRNEKSRDSAYERSDKSKEWLFEKSHNKREREKEKEKEKYERSYKDSYKESKYKHKHKDKEHKSESSSKERNNKEKHRHSHSHDHYSDKQKDRAVRKVDDKLKIVVEHKDNRNKDKQERRSERRETKHEKKHREDVHRHHHEHRRKDRSASPYPDAASVESKEIFTKGDSIIINVNFNRSSSKDVTNLDDSKGFQREAKTGRTRDKSTVEPKLEEKSDSRVDKKKYSKENEKPFLELLNTKRPASPPPERQDKQKLVQKLAIGESYWQENDISENVEDNACKDISDDDDDDARSVDMFGGDDPASSDSDNESQHNMSLHKDENVQEKVVKSERNSTLENDNAISKDVDSFPVRRSPRSPSPPSPPDNDSYDPCEPTMSPSPTPESLTPVLSSVSGTSQEKPKPPPSPELPPLPPEPEPAEVPPIENSMHGAYPTSATQIGLCPQDFAAAAVNSVIPQTVVYGAPGAAQPMSLPNIRIPPPNFLQQTVPRNSAPVSIATDIRTVSWPVSNHPPLMFATTQVQPVLQGNFAHSQMQTQAFTAGNPAVVSQISPLIPPPNPIALLSQLGPHHMATPGTLQPGQMIPGLPPPVMNLPLPLAMPNLNQPPPPTIVTSLPNQIPTVIVTSSAPSHVMLDGLSKVIPQDMTEVIDMDVESPYSPGDSPSFDSGDEKPLHSSQKSGYKDNFDALLGRKAAADKRNQDKVKVRSGEHQTRSLVTVATYPAERDKSEMSAKRQKMDRAERNRHGRLEIVEKSKSRKDSKSDKKEIIIRLDESQLKILDDLPSSAVEMQVKEKFLKKLNRQERVVEEVKVALKPYYTKRDISKEEYKDVLRKSVPKICHNKSGEINPVKIKSLVDGYVKKIKYLRKKTAKGQKSKTS